MIDEEGMAEFVSQRGWEQVDDLHWRHDDHPGWELVVSAAFKKALAWELEAFSPEAVADSTPIAGLTAAFLQGVAEISGSNHLSPKELGIEIHTTVGVLLNFVRVTGDHETPGQGQELVDEVVKQAVAMDEMMAQVRGMIEGLS